MTDPSAIRNGDRAALARAITLVESTRREDQDRAQDLLRELMPHTGKAMRVGITGVPGAGKSTFIDVLGMRLLSKGHAVAVLAVDPSSARSGGSILGDKTRMAKLSTDRRAFIRPSPGAPTAGGVARRTREAGLLCEAAGFDVVLVETIGIGQSEVAVADLVDTFLLLQLARSGDDLQGIKRGVMEFVDIVAVHKADGPHQAVADEARQQYAMALSLLQSATANWTVPVLTASSVTGDGIDSCWDAIQEHRAHLVATGQLAARRQEQSLRWMDAAVREFLYERVDSEPAIAAQLSKLRSQVGKGEIQPTDAARQLTDRVFGSRDT